jgi:hypothetical protein
MNHRLIIGREFRGTKGKLMQICGGKGGEERCKDERLEYGTAKHLRHNSRFDLVPKQLPRKTIRADKPTHLLPFPYTGRG